MTNNRPTIRASVASTVEDRTVADAHTPAVARIMEFWRSQTDGDVVQAIEAFPSLLENKSLLLEMVLKDFHQKRQIAPVPIDKYCENFQQFGSSIEQSIFRALEVQDYFDAHPEILELIVRFDWPSAGDSLQGFNVVDELGRGALARVYLCLETGIGGREVVVKIARGGSYEADLLGRLDHPNIVPIYSVTNDPERCASYICMPFRGRSTLLDLVDSLRKGAVPKSDLIIWKTAQAYYPDSPDEIQQNRSADSHRRQCISYVDGVLRLAVQLTSALKHAHQMGVYHGDLKPSNVLLTPGAIPLLIDFNLATDANSNAVPRGGTLAYMPPEQLRGLASGVRSDAVKYDARSELYSFGALLFQLLTGDVPYHIAGDQSGPAELAQRLITLQRGTIPCIRTKNPAVNSSLEKLILSCLAINPGARPSSMAELDLELQAQCRASAKFERSVASHPVAARCLTLFALATVILASLYLFLRPPYHERQFARGKMLQENERYESALAHFDRAIASDPMDQAAPFERARTKLFQTDYVSAVKDFARLWKKTADPRCAAYAGYAFNLQGNPSAAIPWYELAISHGMETAGVHNNLGLSYAKGRSTAGQIERFDLAQRHLRRALALDSESLAIRGSIVQIALMRSDVDPTFTPESVVEHLEYLRQRAPQSPTGAKYAVFLYGLLSKTDKSYVSLALSALENAIRMGANPSVSALRKSSTFHKLRFDPRFDALVAAAAISKASAPDETVASFIDPITGDERRRVNR